MTKNNRGPFEPGGLTVSYKALGTISIDELRDAVVEDMHALRDIYNIRYVKDIRIKIVATNEYGEEVRIRRPGGGPIYYMDTHHYRPSCMDYEL